MTINKYILGLLYFIAFIAFMLLIINKKFENFSTIKFSNSNIHSIILSPIDEREESDKTSDKNNKINKYYGTYIINQSNKNENDAINSLDIYSATDSFQGAQNWIKLNDKLNSNDNIVITDITYDNQKRMMAIGLSYKYEDNSKIPVYNIYIKETEDINSAWGEPINPDISIRNLCYDIKTEKLLGVSSYDGQIYEKKLDHSFNEWVGPINNDIPMRKIMFDRAETMIGIGLFDNYIYIKKSNNWRQSYWDKVNINKTKVYDLLYDYDGCLIATSPDGILKQKFPELSSEFINYRTYNRWDNKNPEILSKEDILKYKTGYNIMNNDSIFFDNSPFAQNLKSIYNIKKMALDLCSNKKYIQSGTNENDNNISYKYRDISNLYKKIEEINDKMTK
tara:strand:- start:63 stop:1241 length:1179 start_codon:yes stop_codon:yes gene_type:complete